MLMHITQLTNDEVEAYDFQDNTEESDAYININHISSVIVDDEDNNRCFVYMTNEDYFHVKESIESFVMRYQAMLYGTVLTKFYDSSNKQN